MYLGRFKRTPDDYSGHQAYVFTPHLFEPTVYGRAGCGATALGLLSGINPNTIRDQNRGRTHYSDRFMVQFLRKHKFTVQPVTHRGITSHKDNVYPIGRRHVVLTSQRFHRNEASWLVMHRNIIYHNFEIGGGDMLDLINKPTLSVYCVFHPNWSLAGSEKIK